MAKILIAVPTFESIYPDTFKSIWELDKDEHEVIFDFVRGYDTASARNNIVALAKGYNADYVMMVDSDVYVPQDALLNMLEDDKDVVLGYYAHRNRANDETVKTCLCKLGEINYTMQFTADELTAMRERGEYVFRIHGGGMGCALIKTSVFNRMPYPYYDWKNYNDANHSLLSEDLYFCEQCRFAGIDIFGDSRVACGHMFRKLKFI